MTTSTPSSFVQVATTEQNEAIRNALASMVDSYVSAAATSLTMPSEIATLAGLDPDFPVADYEDALAKLRAIHASLQPR